MFKCVDLFFFDDMRELVNLLFESIFQVSFKRLVKTRVFQICCGVLNSQPFCPNYSGYGDFDAKIRNSHRFQIPKLKIQRRLLIQKVNRVAICPADNYAKCG